ncbi:hypothetical protein B0J13DRAFT_288376 [Dactylonectria estremocensis]|uniref:G-patch domain-containing protein n=1 Tax=Dactylonectria estremocensis TaxID=1079267 RepID=A0A9P9F1L0_9HYPO|nr:hypothetical protein B0J13DRAFT_288376 [Dactylonectria estremocensis]
MQRFRGFAPNTGSDDGSNDEDEIPLHHKRAFGAGLKRQRVEFVPAKDPDAGIKSTIESSKTPATTIGDLYASVVLKAAPSALEPKDEPTSQDATEICPVCALPATASSRPHEASLAHQVCLTHSHPPSALDRSRMGLRALEAQGWDPDARRGLGREGDGMRYPIKVAAKDDTLGIGATVPESVRKKERVEKPKKLNRKEMRQLAEKERLRNERLQGEIFGRVDVERYLRGDG